jgi:hypothetical protein
LGSSSHFLILRKFRNLFCACCYFLVSPYGANSNLLSSLNNRVYHIQMHSILCRQRFLQYYQDFQMKYARRRNRPADTRIFSPSWGVVAIAWLHWNICYVAKNTGKIWLHVVTYGSYNIIDFVWFIEYSLTELALPYSSGLITRSYHIYIEGFNNLNWEVLRIGYVAELILLM